MTVTQNISDAATTTLAESHEFCRRLTRRAARNFYFGLKLLPQQTRADMFALYGWMRSIDDIADDNDGRPAELRRERLQSWQSDTHRSIAGENVPGLLWPAFGEMVRRHEIPSKIFDDALKGSGATLTLRRSRMSSSFKVIVIRSPGR